MPDYTAPDLQDVFVYAIIDEYLQNSKHRCLTRCSATGQPAKLSDAEILFIFVSACLEYGGNCLKAMQAHRRHGNIRYLLDKSQFNRRLHRLTPVVEELLCLFSMMAATAGGHCALDSFPLPVCRNVRIKRCKLVRGEHYRGYCASKKEYYYGFKVHLVTASDGRIVEFEFTPGASADANGLNLLQFQLPPETRLFADKAYNHYGQEANLLEHSGVHLQPIRKGNSRKEDNTYVGNWLRKHYRRHIESDISSLQTLFPKKIHAVTKEGFLLKILGFFLAHHFSFYL
ncbi:IS982 family transposase [Rufibacter immobilis]|uniref:IS982 family transposase n=1 Tax=Rufibacter immobilis TaxID=1348778 RepID=UPI0035F002EB